MCRKFIELEKGYSFNMYRQFDGVNVFIGAYSNISNDKLTIEISDFGSLKYAMVEDALIFYDTYEINKAGGENKWNQ